MDPLLFSPGIGTRAHIKNVHLVFGVSKYRNFIVMYQRAGALFMTRMEPPTQDTGKTSPIQDD